MSRRSSPQAWPLTGTISQVCGTTPTKVGNGSATQNDPSPGYYVNPITLDGSQTNETYCSQASVGFSGNNKSYNVTVVAPTISVSGQPNQTYCPYFRLDGPDLLHPGEWG